MTAAELERIATQCERSQCQHAADYRRAAARIRELEAHARLGSLVAAIREKRLALRDVSGKGGNFVIGVGEPRIYFLAHDDDGFEEALSHLDSLLPKEPEVVVGPSGWRYRRGNRDEWAQVREHGTVYHFLTASDPGIPPADAPVVAAMLAGGARGE